MLYYVSIKDMLIIKNKNKYETEVLILPLP